MVNHHGGVVLLDDHLYGFSDGKGWVCQKFMTGEMVWNERSKLGKGCLTYADGHLYLRSEGGTFALIEAKPTGYVETGRFEQPNRSGNSAWPHPVVSGGRLYIRDQDILLCYNVTDGAASGALGQ
jgi:outer membrane protein assembly factor BamB